MHFLLTLIVFIFGAESKPVQHEYEMPSYDECMKSSESIYNSFLADPTVHEVAVQCVAHRDDPPPESRDG